MLNLQGMSPILKSVVGTILMVLTCSLVQAQGKEGEFLALAREKASDENYSLALVDIDSALSYSPNSVEAFKLRAWLKQKMEDYEGAINDFTQAITVRPDAETYFLRSEMYQVADYHRDFVINDLGNAIALDRNSVKYLVRRAHIRATTINTVTGDLEYNKAISDISRAIRIEPGNARLYHIRGDYKFELGDRLSALTDMNRAIENDPQEHSFHGRRGLMKLLMEDYPGAAQDLTEAIRLNANQEEYYRHRGHANYNTGRYTGAVTDYTRSINTLFAQTQSTTDQDKLTAITEKLRDLYLIRGSAFALLERDGEACDDFSRSRDLGERKAYNYLRKYCR